MALAIFLEIIFPLLEVGRTILILISSPTDPFNFFSRMLTMTDPVTGRPLFLVYHLRLICDRCANKKDSLACRHNLHLLPPWKTQAKQNVVQKIVESDPMMAQTLAAESRGMIVDRIDNGKIPASAIEALDNAPLFYDKQQARNAQQWKAEYIITVMDPNTTASVTSSDAALVSIAVFGNQYLVREIIHSFIHSFLRRRYGLGSVGAQGHGDETERGQIRVFPCEPFICV